ncbi:MAG: PEP-CTERM sorting domain-containing protein [Kiritimatiellae bacterium]|nr:PEP-CTERM sorting domain-containing protein [Kiritimatiellia bacterium]
MRYRQGLCAVIGSVLIMFSCRGQVITQTREVVPHLPGASRTLSFDRVSEEFMLQSIQLIFSTWMYGGRIEWDNDSEESATVGGVIGTKASLTSTDVTLSDGSQNPWINVINTSTATLQAGPTTGDALGEFNQTFEADHAVLSGPQQALAQKVSVSAYLAPEFWSDFIGSGVFSINYRDWQSQSSWTDGATYSISTPSAGYAGVSLIYTAVPEPGTLTLIGLSGALVFCGVIRRKTA